MHVQKNPSGTLGTSITKSRCPLPIQGISLRKAIKMISANKEAISNNLVKSKKFMVHYNYISKVRGITT